MELEQENIPATPAPPPFHYEPKVSMVLLVQILLFILGSGFGALAFSAVALAMGWDISLVLGEQSPEPDRWQLRLQLGLGHLCAFLGSGMVTIWLFYRNLTGVGPGWQDYLKSRKIPALSLLGWSLLLMAVSIPFVLFTLNLNQKIPLPDYFRLIEDQTASMLKGLLQMNHFGEFLGNLCIIALLPAIGEELVFRGVVQQQIMRKVANPWLAIVLASVIFSLAHFQLEGFLPRMVLGIILGWLYWQTNNFWIPAAGHFFNNGIQVIGQYLYGQEVSSVDLEQDIQVPWELALISLFLMWVIFRNIRKQSATSS